MNFAAARALIETRFETQWAARTPIEWENQAFDVPENGPYVRFSINEGNTLPGTVGITMVRAPGIVQVDVYAVNAGGTAAADAAADAVVSALNFVNLSSSGHYIRFRTAARRQGMVVDGWYHVPVVIPYLRDAT